MQLSLFLDTTSGKTNFSSASLNSRMTIEDIQPFIPENSAAYILAWFQSYPVHLAVSKSRSSKFGDYRAPVKNSPARISVNRNLNRFDFLITLVHEMAHHELWAETNAPVPGLVFPRRKRRPRPHGREWKNHYHRLIGPMMKETIFPSEVLYHLEKYFENPGSSSKLNEHLSVALRKYDLPDGSVFIESLPPDTLFYLPSGRKFRKQEKLRKRYRCICLDNRKVYLFSPTARVVPIPA